MILNQCFQRENYVQSTNLSIVQICIYYVQIQRINEHRDQTIVQPLKSGFSGSNSKHKWRDHLANLIGYYM